MVMNSYESATFLETQRQKLEDAFFQENDKKLIEQLKAMKKKKETKAALQEVSGIQNDAVLEKLLDLEVRPETLASLSIIPLIEVAWADGSVSKEEETAILKAAQNFGYKKGSPQYQTLEEWLMVKPKATLLAAWTHYIEGLSEKLTKKEIAAIKKDLLGHAQEVAEASGGVLGIGAISKEEKAVIKKMEKAFEGN